MNSAMRAAVGLPPKNWRSGLSAHDVYMAVCSKDIIVTRADKEAGTPTTKSRWLQRMEVVINALGLNGDIDDGATEKAWLENLNQRRYPNSRFDRRLVRHWQAVPASFRQPKLIFGSLTPTQYMLRKFCNLNRLMILTAALMRRFEVFYFMMRLLISARQMSLANWTKMHCNNCLILAKPILRARLASHQSAISGGQDLRRWPHGLSKMNIDAVMLCNQFMLKLVV